ncbi:diguanylate cyclase [Affinibrenneria salicis]|uniref:diguanylate cyclase n=1 Tax=Affinibrenneria salicis TaxID=2590031 RepID=A0A5J5G297_9GAMM|nr:sensor domain-containing diguanylate cyclase [Affinibrenneria salicis]KAA9000602.1 diguanylate cyclase [Affinibrenneria salicis]
MIRPYWLNKKGAIILFTAMLLVAFFIISWSSYQVARQSLIQEIEENSLPLTGDNVYSEIQQDLLRPIFISSLMAHDTFVRDWLLNNETDSQAMIRYLHEIDRRFDTVEAYFVSDKTRRYYDPQRVLGTVSEQSADDKWYFDVKSLPADQAWMVDLRTDPEDRTQLDIFINYKVMDYDDNVIGVTGVGISVEKIRHFIEDYQQRYNRTIYFIDKTGEVTLHGQHFKRPLNIRRQTGLAPLTTAILTVPGGAWQYQADGRQIYLHTRYIPEFDWYLMIEQTNHPAEQKLWLTLMQNMGISAAVSALFLFFLWLTIGGYQRRLERMATTDKLTGLMNRQAFEDQFRRISPLTRHGQRQRSLLLLDVDHFKQVNDRDGHIAGDRVLQHIATLIQNSIRTSDQACRWGGEEFAILLEDCGEEAAFERAEALRVRIGESVTESDHRPIQVTISCGVAESFAQETLDALINRADVALYQAKQQGRNRSVRADLPERRGA